MNKGNLSQCALGSLKTQLKCKNSLEEISNRPTLEYLISFSRCSPIVHLLWQLIEPFRFKHFLGYCANLPILPSSPRQTAINVRFGSSSLRTECNSSYASASKCDGQLIWNSYFHEPDRFSLTLVKRFHQTCLLCAIPRCYWSFETFLAGILNSSSI